MKSIFPALLAGACLLLAGCHTAGSMRDAVAKKCEIAGVEPVLFMVEGPKEHVGGDRWRKTDPRMQMFREPTFYRWLWIAIETYSPTCLVSAFRLAEAARPGDPVIVPSAVTGRGELDVDHLQYDPAHREATYSIAARAGAKYLVVARWMGGKRARYMRQDMVASGSGWESRATKVVGVSANFEAHVHNVIERRMLYRKTYSLYEELGVPHVLNEDDDEVLRATPLREAAVRALQEDFLRYRQSPVHVTARGGGTQRFDPPLSFPLQVLDKSRPYDPGLVKVELHALHRTDALTRVELRLRNEGKGNADVRLWSNDTGLMAFAKTSMGQVYRAVEDRRQEPSLRLRPGEAKELAVSLHNDAGALGQVTFTFDFDLRVGSAQGVRRATFTKVVAN